MSSNTPDHYASGFESSVIHFYQQKMMRLRGTVRHRNGSGSEADRTFFRMGKNEATQRARGANITLNNVDRPTALVTPVELESSEWVDRQDEKRLTYDNKDALAQKIAFGLARAADGQIITAGYTGDAARVTAGGTAYDFSGADPVLEHLTFIEAWLSENDVPEEGQVTVLVTPTIFSKFMLFEAFNTADWVDYSGQTLNKRNRIRGKDWNGLHILKHTGLTKTGNTLATHTADCLAYHESAIGHLSLDDVTIETANTLANDKPGTNIYGYIDAGAVAIDYNGIVKFTMKNHLTAPTS